jgi:DNA-binding NarL/FixJ family response regulator
VPGIAWCGDYESQEKSGVIEISDSVLNAAVKPFKPLTPAEERVANLVGRGWAYKRIAATLRTSPRSVQHHVEAIAAKLPNEDNLAPRETVLIWSLCVTIKKLLSDAA